MCVCHTIGVGSRQTTDGERGQYPVARTEKKANVDYELKLYREQIYAFINQ